MPHKHSKTHADERLHIATCSQVKVAAPAAGRSINNHDLCACILNNKEISLSCVPATCWCLENHTTFTEPILFLPSIGTCRAYPACLGADVSH